MSFPKAPDNPVSLMHLTSVLGAIDDVINPVDGVISSVASPAEADAGSLVFCRQSTQESLTAALKATQATFIVVGMRAQAEPHQTLIVVTDPMGWFIKALGILFDGKVPSGIHPKAVVSDDIDIAPGVDVGAGTVIEPGCTIGAGCSIGHNCFIGANVLLGDDCFVQDGASIGGVGLGYHMAASGERLFFPHLGKVRVGHSAVIGTGTAIVRGQLQDTVIGDRVRLGNLVNIGHNVHVGADSVLSSSTSVAGGARIGQRCNIAAGVVINAKCTLADDCQVGLGSVVVRDVAPKTSVFGNPAAPLRTMKKF